MTHSFPTRRPSGLRLAEIGQQRLPPAARTFAERDKCVEALALDALAVFARLALLDLQAAQPHVVEAIQRQRLGRQAVAAGAADLLVIGLHIGRRSEEHTSELQSLMRISYAVFCLKKKKRHHRREYRYRSSK